MMPAAPPSPTGPRPWWETRQFVAAMILLALVPLLYPPIPPLVDLPGHIGRFRVELGLSESPLLQRYYDYHWALVGNLGVDLLIVPFAKIFGLELGTRLIVMAIPSLTVAGFLWVAREVHNRIPPTAMFALPFAYGHPFMFGFVNYAFAMALAFLAFGLWLRLGRLGKTRLRAALFVPISFIVFIAHTFGWGALGLMCFSAEAVRQHDNGRRWWAAIIHGAIHAACLALPVVMLLSWRHEANGGLTADWFDFKWKKMWIEMALRDRWATFDRLAVVATGLVLLAALVLRRWLAFSRNLAFSTLVMAAIYVLLPRVIFGSAYADMRLVPFIIALALLSIRFRGQTHMPTARTFAVLGLAFVLIKTAGNTASLAMASDIQRSQLTALDHVPPGSRVLFLSGRPCGKGWTLPRGGQLGGMVIARRDGRVNNEWRMPGSQLLTIKDARRLGWWSNDPSQLVLPDRCGNREHWAIDQSLSLFPRQEFDYVWMVDPPSFDPRRIDDLTLIWRGPYSLLYRVAP